MSTIVLSNVSARTSDCGYLNERTCVYRYVHERKIRRRQPEDDPTASTTANL